MRDALLDDAIDEMRAYDAAAGAAADDEEDAEDLEEAVDGLNEVGTEIQTLGVAVRPFAKLPQVKSALPGLRRMTQARKKVATSLRRLGARRATRQHRCPAVRVVDGRGPITPAERKNTKPMKVSIFARIRLKSGALSTSFPDATRNGFRVFGVGQGESGAAYGIASNLTIHDTNLLKDGRLPDGHWFQAHGVEVTPISRGNGALTDADLDVLGDAIASWRSAGGKRVLPLPRLGLMPSAAFQNSSGRRSAFFNGEAWRSKEPLFVLRDDDDKHELEFLFPDPSLELSQAHDLLIELVGIQGVNPGAQ